MNNKILKYLYYNFISIILIIISEKIFNQNFFIFCYPIFYKIKKFKNFFRFLYIIFIIIACIFKPVLRTKKNVFKLFFKCMNIYFLNKILYYYEIGIITLKFNQNPNYFTYVIMYLCIFNFLFSIRNFIFILIDINFILKIAKNIFFSNFIINRYNSINNSRDNSRNNSSNNSRNNNSFNNNFYSFLKNLIEQDKRYLYLAIFILNIKINFIKKKIKEEMKNKIIDNKINSPAA